MSDASSTLNEVRKAIYQRFMDEWNNLTPYVFDNEQFAPDTPLPPEGAPWVRLSVRHLSGGPRTMGPVGNRKFGRQCMAFLQIFGPPNTGTSVGDILMTAGKNLFEGRTLPGTSVMFQEVFPRELGVIEDGRWWGSTIQANFAYDEIK